MTEASTLTVSVTSADATSCVPPLPAPPPAEAVGHRLRMLRLAVRGEAGVVVDERECRREGVGYTIDTLRGLRAGADSIKWAAVQR